MRKLVYILLFAAAVVSCSKNDVIGEVQGDAISFGKVFVGNSTKADPSYTVGNLTEFYVYGNVLLNNNITTIAKLYETTPVTLKNSAWDCGVTQYWLPGCTYNFAAITDVGFKDSQTATTLVSVDTDAAGLPSSINYDVRAQKDLLYAEIKEVKTDEIGVPDNKIESTTIDGKTSHSVAFNFSHLLSKVQFQFTNGFPADNDPVILEVKEIKITNALGSATYTIATGTWIPTTSTAVIDFGNTAKFKPTDTKEVTSSNQCMLIPGTYTNVDITFTVEHNKGGSATPKKITMPELELKAGYSYNLTAELNSSNVEGVVPIKFKISINDGYGSGNTDKDVQY